MDIAIVLLVLIILIYFAPGVMIPLAVLLLVFALLGGMDRRRYGSNSVEQTLGGMYD